MKKILSEEERELLSAIRAAGGPDNQAPTVKKVYAVMLDIDIAEVQKRLTTLLIEKRLIYYNNSYKVSVIGRDELLPKPRMIELWHKYREMRNQENKKTKNEEKEKTEMPKKKTEVKRTAKKDNTDDVPIPGEGSKMRRIWDKIAALHERKGVIPTRQQLLNGLKARKEEFNPSSVSVMLSKYRKYYG